MIPSDSSSKSWRVAAVALLVAACTAEGPQVLPHDPPPKLTANSQTCPVMLAEVPGQFRYPREAYNSGQEGWARFRFDVDAEGAPTNIRAMDSSPRSIFESAARDMLAETKFANRDSKDCEFLVEYRKPVTAAPK